MNDVYDVVVLGGGPVGENVADRAVKGGLTAVVIESELVGGECSYWACMPSKALLRPSQALRTACHVGGSSQAISGSLDVRGVLDWRDGFTSHWSDESQVEWLRNAGIDLVRGHARLSGERRVEVTNDDGSTRELVARHAVAISTGSRATVPDIPGLRDAQPWTSREATSTQEVPPSLVVIGGGVVGVELATAYQELGSEVTVLARSGLLGGFEPFAGELVLAGLRDLGATVHTGVTVESVHRSTDGRVTVTHSGGVVTAAEVLAATGRTPRSHDIGLETVGLEAGTAIPTDDSLRVPGADWLYAVGDVNSRAPLTHQGKYQARVAGDAIIARARGEHVVEEAWGPYAATADHLATSQVVFSAPEVASVGRTAQAAEDAGIRTVTVEAEFSSVAGAALRQDGFDGTAQLVVDAERMSIVGATFVGTEVAELVHAATVAVVGEVPLFRLAHAVPAYPTVSEIWLRLLEAFEKQHGPLDGSKLNTDEDARAQ